MNLRFMIWALILLMKIKLLVRALRLSQETLRALRLFKDPED